MFILWWKIITCAMFSNLTFVIIQIRCLKSLTFGELFITLNFIIAISANYPIVHTQNFTAKRVIAPTICVDYVTVTWHQSVDALTVFVAPWRAKCSDVCKQQYADHPPITSRRTYRYITARQQRAMTSLRRATLSLSNDVSYVITLRAIACNYTQRHMLYTLLAHNELLLSSPQRLYNNL